MVSAAGQDKDESAKRHYTLTGFTQAAGIRIYTFEGRIDAVRSGYTVAVDLALIPAYGIRIQDLPWLCSEFLQQQAQADESSALVFTEQRMRCHAEKLAIAKNQAPHWKSQSRHAANEGPEAR